MLKISIIVPIYNVEQYLDRCIKSIVEQTYRNLEIILVDDGSPDSCGDICDRWAKIDERIKVLHKENGGLSSARNVGLDVATGDYIGFVDSDDYIAPDMYETLLLAIGNKEESVLVNTMVCRFDDNGVMGLKAECKAETISSLEYLRRVLMHKGDVSACTKLFPSRLFENVRFAVGRVNEDVLLMLDIMGHINGIRFVGKVGYYYYIRQGSISSGFGKAICDMVDNSVTAYEYVINNYPELKDEAKRFVAYQHMAYLLLVPDDRTGDLLYKTALLRLRKMWMSALFNRHLTLRQKAIITGLVVCPRKMAHIYQKSGG